MRQMFPLESTHNQNRSDHPKSRRQEQMLPRLKHRHQGGKQGRNWIISPGAFTITGNIGNIWSLLSASVVILLAGQLMVIRFKRS